MGRVVCDIDGVLAYPVSYDRYHVAEACKSNIDILKALVDRGHTVLLYTSRLEVDRGVTEAWLRHHGVPYSALFMEKPLGDVYLDDKALRMTVRGRSKLSLEKIKRCLGDV